MMSEQASLNNVKLHQLLDMYLVPYVKKIDQEAHYAESYLQKLGEAGYFTITNKTQSGILLQRTWLVEETAKVCMTTAFCLWCHLASITYITHSNNTHLQQNILPKLISGKLIAATGLSNPLKAFAQLERNHLTATKVAGGYVINGCLPAVSNIEQDHGLAFIANVSEEESIMFLTMCNVHGLTLQQHKNFFGLNGSATYRCNFEDVFVSNENIIANKAFEFIQQVRAEFVSYQIPLGLGVIAASVKEIEAALSGNDGINKSLRVQPSMLNERYHTLRDTYRQLIQKETIPWNQIIQIRLEVAYLTLDAVQAGMIHSGGAGYIKTSHFARRLREAYFIVNLTPTVKHLEKIIKVPA